MRKSITHMATARQELTAEEYMEFNCPKANYTESQRNSIMTPLLHPSVGQTDRLVVDVSGSLRTHIWRPIDCINREGHSPGWTPAAPGWSPTV